MTAHDATHDHPAGAAAADIGHVHIVPPRVLLSVWGALLVLTFVTVAVTWFDFGGFNLWIALGIAVVKAALVALYFMHLRYDKPFNGFLLVAALAFVMLLAGAALTDTREYQPQLVQGQAPGAPIMPAVPPPEAAKP